MILVVAEVEDWVVLIKPGLLSVFLVVGLVIVLVVLSTFLQEIVVLYSVLVIVFDPFYSLLLFIDVLKILKIFFSTFW